MEKKRAQVIGGGFSGLAVAYFLTRKGYSVRIVEESDRCGGLLRTIPTAFGLVETAANALLSNALVEETASEIGIELVPTLPSARKRFIYRRGKPRRWPLSGAASVKFLGETVPRFFMARKSFLPREGESVKDWGYRCVGEEVTESLLVPGLSGIYAGRAEELSASLILRRFFGGGKKVKRGRLKGSVAPKEGMGQWGEKFSAWLKNAGAEFSTQVEEGIPTVVALPPPRAKAFLEDKAPSLAAFLSQIKMLPVVSVGCFFPDESLSLDGFGCLFPRSEGFRVLGILANDRIFPGRATKGFISETWIFGGATDPGVISRTDEEILSTIQFERGKIVGQRVPFTHTVINRWPGAIPHYDIALEKALAGRESFTEGDYTLFGTYLGDLGLARVLVRAQELARNFK